MKRYILLISAFILFSCNDDEKRTAEQEDPQYEVIPSEEDQEKEEREVNGTYGSVNTTSGQGAVEFDREPQASDNEIAVKKKNGDPFTGHYIKTSSGEEDHAGGCNCNCLDLSLESSFELCIEPNYIYITATSKKTGPDSAEIYFVSVKKAENTVQEIPWEKFDTSVPIATVERLPNGELDLDWKGFSINGKLATDFAIFGKKALEGTYRKG